MRDGGQPESALYRRLLGARFEVLPARVRELHDVTAPSIWHGSADVVRGPSMPARLLATVLRLPPDGPHQSLRVSFEPKDGREFWTRQFDRAVFRSVQFERDGLQCERIGPSCLMSAPVASSDGLALELRAITVFGVPLPGALHPRVRTFECEHGGRYHFEAEAHLPLVGLLVRYAGWLERAEAPACA
ncbi:MAG: DUF4166 domain-containing protein [Variovorax sp.]